MRRRNSRSPKKRSRSRSRQRKSSSSVTTNSSSETIQNSSWLNSRSRTRSPHPLLKKLFGASVRNKDQKQFWDGFQWVTNPNTLSSTIEAAVEQNKKARTLHVSNIPLEFNVNENDIQIFLRQKLSEHNLLTEEEEPISKTWHDQFGVVVECRNIQSARGILQLDGIRLLGNSLKVIKYDQVMELGSLNNNLGFQYEMGQENTEISAKTAGVAVIAMNQYQTGKEEQLKLDNLEIPCKFSNLEIKSRVLKISNVIDPNKALELTRTQYIEIQDDIEKEFQKHGTIEYIKITMPNLKRIGAESGSIFIVFSQENQSEQAIKAMKGRKYDNRDLQITPVNYEVFVESFKIESNQQ